MVSDAVSRPSLVTAVSDLDHSSLVFGLCQKMSRLDLRRPTFYKPTLPTRPIYSFYLIAVRDKNTVIIIGHNCGV